MCCELHQTNMYLVVTILLQQGWHSAKFYEEIFKIFSKSPFLTQHCICSCTAFICNAGASGVNGPSGFLVAPHKRKSIVQLAE